MFSFCICDDDENITLEIREALEIYARDHGMTFSINIWKTVPIWLNVDAEAVHHMTFMSWI